MIDLEESIDKVAMGPERRSKRMSPEEKEQTAYHEAGHALVAHLLKGTVDPPHKVSIIAVVWPAVIPAASPKTGLIIQNPD